VLARVKRAYLVCHFCKPIAPQDFFVVVGGGTNPVCPERAEGRDGRRRLHESGGNLARKVGEEHNPHDEMGGTYHAAEGGNWYLVAEAYGGSSHDRPPEAVVHAIPVVHGELYVAAAALEEPNEMCCYKYEDA
jgi:hypothetical protein